MVTVIREWSGRLSKMIFIHAWKCVRNIRCRTLSMFVLILFVIIVYFLKFHDDARDVTGRPRIIWWTHNFLVGSNKVSKCGHNFNCEISNDKNLVHDVNTKAFIFYGSDFNQLDLPLPRRGGDIIWGLLHEESPRNTPILSHEAALNLFNYSSTVSRYSNVPLTFQYLDNIDDLLNNHHYMETKEKNKLLSRLSPVIFIQSDCDTSSYRESYIKELMKYISIDSYGSCLNNKELPEIYTVDYLNRLYSDEFLNFVKQYKFTIAFENGICNDYITEKLWRPLRVGSVPIYMGSPTVRDWLPNNFSAVIANDFESPKRLAEFINYLNTHDDEYDKYLEHKIKHEVSNKKLIKALSDKKHRLESNENELFSDEFECFVCLKIHQQIHQIGFKQSAVVNRSHYNCPEPKPPLPSIPASWWLEIWHDSKRQAKVLYKFVVIDNRKNFTESEFNSALLSN